MPRITDPAFGVYGWRRDPPWDMKKPRPGPSFAEEAALRIGSVTHAGMPAAAGGLAGYYGDPRTHIAGTAGSYFGRGSTALARNAGLGQSIVGPANLAAPPWWSRVAVGVAAALIVVYLTRDAAEYSDYDDEQD